MCRVMRGCSATDYRCLLADFDKPPEPGLPLTMDLDGASSFMPDNVGEAGSFEINLGKSAIEGGDAKCLDS
ncbi:MAG TPA: hypothetical protein VH351_17265 [Bryobacteraceae bacterium]|nr:hypothetical protein [Bryobacteraceae bacterium]